jgi:hypothetical protein
VYDEFQKRVKKLIPHPNCCERSKFVDPIIIWFDKKPFKIGWIMGGQWIQYCPFCGVLLPELKYKEKPPLIKIYKPSYDYDNDFCETCSKSGMKCNCYPLEVNLEIVPAIEIEDIAIIIDR